MSFFLPMELSENFVPVYRQNKMRAFDPNLAVCISDGFKDGLLVADGRNTWDHPYT